MLDQKKLWEKLGAENSRHYIDTSFGRGITEEQFRENGRKDYDLHILEDDLITNYGTIIDWGGGTGRLTEFMAKDFKKAIVIDISRTMIEQGKERLKLPNIEFIEFDGWKVPLANETADVVFAYLVFQHYKSREMLVANYKEIYRIMKPGAIFKVLMTQKKRELLSRWWSGVPYTLKEAAEMYEPIGFKLIKQEMFDANRYWLWLRK